MQAYLGSFGCDSRGRSCHPISQACLVGLHRQPCAATWSYIYRLILGIQGLQQLPDHVGSFLRSPAIKEAREKREKGQISAAELTKVEDQEIPKLIKKQEECGLQLATDGEYRRSWWHFDFYGMLDNVDIYELDHGWHHHFICRRCGRILDVPCIVGAKPCLQADLAGAEIDEAAVTFRGLCPQCARRGK